MPSESRRIHAIIASHAESAARSNPGITKSQFISRIYMDRFLTRIFSDSDDTDWVLKGGTGIIARVPLGRRTTDVDLFTTGYEIENAQKRLVELAAIDLGDGFTFDLVSIAEPIDLEHQTYVDLKRLSFSVRIAGIHKEILNVDLAVGPPPIGEIALMEPRERIVIPRFETFPFRLYPIEHQAAEKVCAIYVKYGDNFSSREKDLVDLVVIATQSSLDGETLNKAITFETNRRDLVPIKKFSVPEDWGKRYAAEAKRAPACAQYPHIDDALTLMKLFIDPALKPEHLGTWHPNNLKWLPN